MYTVAILIPANFLMMVYICTKFHKNTSVNFGVMEQIRLPESKLQRGILSQKKEDEVIIVNTEILEGA